MDVVLSNYEYPPDCGGGGEFTAALADELGKRHTVSVIAGERDRQTSTTAPLLSWPIRTARRLHDRAADADVVNTHFTMPTSVFAPLLTGDTPLVVNAMGADVFDPTRYHRIRPVLNLVNRWVAAGADRLIVPSLDMYERLPDIAQERAEVVPYFVDHGRYRPGDSNASSSLDLLTVARLVERKQLETAIRSVKELKLCGYDVSYTIAGTGPNAQELLELASDLGVDEEVTLAGYVDEHDLPALYRAHDIFVLPSAHEAFGIVVVEALSSGLPAVVTNTGGHSEVVSEETGRVVPPESPTEIAEAVLELDMGYSEYSTQARQRVLDNYTPGTVVGEYERIYSEAGAE